MNKKLFPECCLPVTVHELAMFSCSDTENCMIGKCDECFLPQSLAVIISIPGPYQIVIQRPRVIQRLAYSPRVALRGAENKVICESVTITSELPDHSRAAVITSALIR